MAVLVFQLGVERHVKQGPLRLAALELLVGKSCLGRVVLGNVHPGVQQALDASAEGRLGLVDGGVVWLLFPVRLDAGSEHVPQEAQILPDLLDVSGAIRPGQPGVTQPGQREHHRHQPPVDGSRRERRDTRCLDPPVEALVEGHEVLEVASIPGFVDVQQGHHQAGALLVTTDTAGGLDVLGGGLGLRAHDHQTQAGDVYAHGDHVAREGDVNRVALLVDHRELAFESSLGFLHLVGGLA